MGLFGKKVCPICKNKTGFITYRLAGNEKICQSCEKLLRGRYDLVRQGAAFRDTLGDLDLCRAELTINEMKAVQREDIARFGGKYAAFMSVSETFYVPAAGLGESDPGIAALVGRPVALGFCEYGSFKQGDRVRILGKGREKETSILKLIPCTGAYPFEEELIAGAHKTECAENTNAWLVLDLRSGDIECGDKILSTNDLER